MSMTVRLEQTFDHIGHLIGAFDEFGFECRMGTGLNAEQTHRFVHPDLGERKTLWVRDQKVCYDGDYTAEFEKLLGKNLGRLKQAYGVRKAEAKLRAAGHKVRKRKVGNQIRLYVGVR